MGNQGKPYALVVMTNSDVYYISADDAERLADYMTTESRVFYTTDIKSGAKLKLQIAHVSSIVEDSRNVQ